LESVQAWNSDEPRCACPARALPAPFPGMMDDKQGNAMLTLQFAQMASSGTTSPLGFSSMRSGQGVGEVVAIGIEIEADSGRE
jgi:hypothetical protein